MNPSVYQEVKDHFRSHPDVEIAEGRGAQGLKYQGKMFVMFYKGDLSVKLKPETVQEFIESGKGLPLDPGTGSPMKDRLLIPVAQSETWIEMSELSLEAVK